MSCIYLFTNNIVENKHYVGQTKKGFNHRISAHESGHINPNNKSYNTKFYRALRKYGWNNFTTSKIIDCGPEELNKLETFYVAKYDSFKNGYNETTGGDAPEHVSAESNAKRSATHTKRFQNMTEDEKLDWSKMLKERHKKKPMSEETKAKIRASLKKYSKTADYSRRPRSASTRSIKYLRVRKNKISTAYIIENHPKCKYKNFNNLADCKRYLFYLNAQDDIINLHKKTKELLDNMKKCAEQIQEVLNTLKTFKTIIENLINENESSSETS